MPAEWVWRSLADGWVGEPFPFGVAADEVVAAVDVEGGGVGEEGGYAVDVCCET